MGRKTLIYSKHIITLEGPTVLAHFDSVYGPIKGKLSRVVHEHPRVSTGFFDIACIEQDAYGAVHKVGCRSVKAHQAAIGAAVMPTCHPLNPAAKYQFEGHSQRNTSVYFLKQHRALPPDVTFLLRFHYRKSSFCHPISTYPDFKDFTRFQGRRRVFNAFKYINLPFLPGICAKLLDRSVHHYTTEPDGRKKTYYKNIRLNNREAKRYSTLKSQQYR